MCARATRLSIWRRDSEAQLLRAADDAEKLELTANAKTEVEQPQPLNPYGRLVVILKYLQLATAWHQR